MLIVRLIRAEDIPMEREATGTYVDVNILPLNLQSHTFQPSDTTININFRYKNFFCLLSFWLFRGVCVGRIWTLVKASFQTQSLSFLLLDMR